MPRIGRRGAPIVHRQHISRGCRIGYDGELHRTYPPFLPKDANAFAHLAANILDRYPGAEF